MTLPVTFDLSDPYAPLKRTQSSNKVRLEDVHALCYQDTSQNAFHTHHLHPSITVL